MPGLLSSRQKNSEQPPHKRMMTMMMMASNFQADVNSKICMVAERCYEKWPQTVNLVILLMTVMWSGWRSRDEIGYEKVS